MYFVHREMEPRCCLTWQAVPSSQLDFVGRLFCRVSMRTLCTRKWSLDAALLGRLFRQACWTLWAGCSVVLARGPRAQMEPRCCLAWQAVRRFHWPGSSAVLPCRHLRLSWEGRVIFAFCAPSSRIT
ncbi:hypothetical protein DUNSADRAFT_17834 [Dunaliella salina]|uniref:Uncharacterized protein n=1 Tax=Dunaliella salina TaxID=3046 RepID=A0ABQ7GZR6_DUNSA|nr:hypothetical protein DUNSADRAFT_17834 [Dunaliella salina]|eukprot:KAF5840099.1 hypothetical protein DUNSADRAFT_17834 [Dunaliella salina]